MASLAPRRLRRRQPGEEELVDVLVFARRPEAAASDPLEEPE
jgi:hypothetical protein